MKRFTIWTLIIISSISLYAQEAKRSRSSGSTKSSSWSTSQSSKASSANYSTNDFDFSSYEKLIKVTFGMQGTGLNLGAEYEYRAAQRPFTAYALIGLENTDANKPQLLLFGAGLPFYVLETSKNNVSINPGVGLASIKIGSGSTQFTAGLQLKISAIHQFSEKIHLGLEHLIYTNWINSKLSAQDGSVTQLTYCIHL